MPVYVHVIDHPDARVLVDTGMTELHPAAADLDPRLRPLSKQDFDLAGIDIVVNTHLHFDHCGGNHLFAGRAIYVQRQELEDARTEERTAEQNRLRAREKKVEPSGPGVEDELPPRAREREVFELGSRVASVSAGADQPEGARRGGKEAARSRLRRPGRRRQRRPSARRRPRAASRDPSRLPRSFAGVSRARRQASEDPPDARTKRWAR